MEKRGGGAVDSEGLFGELTGEEKVGLLAGSDLWRTPGVDRLGIPPLKMTDGPAGARGGSFTGGAPSASFPCGTALAATWNVELVGEIGRALGEQARSKGAQVLLAPTVNIHRSPLAGRNFECFSEDPHLAARLAVAYITGVQSQRVATAVKHFVANDSEFERHTISSEVGERALREIYLLPFEAAVREAGSWSLMSAYNKVNGTWCGEHPRLLTALLRDEWGWDGFVVSDWIGTHSTEAAAVAGLDVEMPGPPRFFGSALADAVRSGAVDQKIVDDKVRRVLLVRERTGLFDGTAAPDDERADDLPEHRALIRRAGTEAIVMLKNDDAVLPLDASGLRTIAVIGQNASVMRAQGGGSARVRAHYGVTVLDAVRAAAGSATIVYERGCLIDLGVPVLHLPVTVEAFAGTDLSASPVSTSSEDVLDFRWWQEVPNGIDEGGFSIRLRGRFRADEAGTHTFSLTGVGRCRLLLDGDEVVDNWTDPRRGDSFFGLGSAPVNGTVELAAGDERELVVEYEAGGDRAIRGLTVGCQPPVPDDLMERAVAAAIEADVAIVVAGMNDQWETEGRDRSDMNLPGAQVEMIERVAVANPRTIVVVNAGSPVAMGWADRVPAVLQSWYLGQEQGNAIADVLFGVADPGGRLPTTIPYRLEDTPAFTNYPGERGKVVYGEGVFVGYRWYDKRDIAPRYPFGYGLSFTTFDYGKLRTSASEFRGDDTLAVDIDITNTGDRRGSDVVQLYVADADATVLRPPQELKAFVKVALDAGETKTARFALDRSAFSFYDVAASTWVAEPGEFELRIGASSRDIRQRATVTLV